MFYDFAPPPGSIFTPTANTDVPHGNPAPVESHNRSRPCRTRIGPLIQTGYGLTSLVSGAGKNLRRNHTRGSAKQFQWVDHFGWTPASRTNRTMSARTNRCFAPNCWS